MMNLKFGTLFLVLLGSAACTTKPGAEGVYRYQKEATKAGFMKDVGAKPNQEMLKSVMGFLDGLEAEVELKAGGDSELRTTAVVGGKPKSETGKGTWSQDDKALSFKSKDDETKCERAGAMISCDIGLGLTVLLQRTWLFAAGAFAWPRAMPNARFSAGGLSS